MSDITMKPIYFYNLQLLWHFVLLFETLTETVWSNLSWGSQQSFKNTIQFSFPDKSLAKLTFPNPVLSCKTFDMVQMMYEKNTLLRMPIRIWIISSGPRVHKAFSISIAFEKEIHVLFSYLSKTSKVSWNYGAYDISFERQFDIVL